jgi:hypothetical protein
LDDKQTKYDELASIFADYNKKFRNGQFLLNYLSLPVIGNVLRRDAIINTAFAQNICKPRAIRISGF